MSTAKIYLNGKIVPLAKAQISVMDRGLFYGDGIFESLRTYRGQPFLLDAHLKRLFHGLKILRIRPPFSANQLKLAVKHVLLANNFAEAYIKIIVTRGPAKGHGLDPFQAPGSPTTIILAEKLKPYPKEVFTKGWKAIISSVPRANVPTSKIKSLNYVDNMLAKIEAKKNGAQEALMLDERGNVAEGSVSNVFMVKNGTLYTPPKAAAILFGLTRDLVIHLAKRAGLAVVEKFIKPKELYAASECFITFSGAGIIPITKIWQRTVGPGQCGPITSLLIKLYDAETNKI
jgi:branched-chain amino acid aminotransferase